jgi:hypothetical protein
VAFGTATVKTNAAFAIISNRMISAGTEPKWQGIGTGATGAARTAVAADTALTTEVETRPTAGGTRITTTQTNDTNQWILTTTCTADRSVDEAGLFDAVTTGNMFISATFSVVSLKVAGPDALQLTWKWQHT